MMKRLAFGVVRFCLCNGLFAQTSPQIEAELQYSLYRQIADKAELISSAGDLGALAEAYYYLQMRDSSALTARKAADEPRSQICLARYFAQIGVSDSCCIYLNKYLSNTDKMHKAKIVLDTAFARIEKEMCWKAIWKQDWYPQPTAEDEYALLISTGRYTQVLDELQTLGTKAHKYSYYKAEALREKGQEKEALSALRDARTQRELALKWELENTLGRDKPAANSAKRLLTRCHNCAEGMKKLGISAYKIGDTEVATKQIDAYLAIYYMDTEALYIKALMQSDSKQYLNALETTAQALHYSPQHAPSVLLRGDIFCQVNNWEYAANMYSQYLDWKGSSADVYYALGVALLKAGKKQQACREMEFAKHFGSLPAIDFYRAHCLK